MLQHFYLLDILVHVFLKTTIMISNYFHKVANEVAVSPGFYLLNKAKGLWVQDWPISYHYASRDRDSDKSRLPLPTLVETKIITYVTVRFMPTETLLKCQMVERLRTGGLVDQNHYKWTRTDSTGRQGFCLYR